MISLYCDGSSSGKKTGPGGWAWVAFRTGNILGCRFGGEKNATNNQMELRAAIEGLQYLVTLQTDEDVELVSDSQYVLGMASGSYRPKKNVKLVEMLQVLAQKLRVTTRWVRGHSGDPVNEICDRLAKRGKEQQ